MITWKELCERADNVSPIDSKRYQVMAISVEDFDKIRAVVEAAQLVRSDRKICWYQKLTDALKDLGVTDASDHG